MPQIQRLSQSLINKIAAGEVIERPASVVKELVENAVDAGATRIDVSATAGGLEMIRVADNGCGIAPDQLPLAVAAHATSKLADADDLFRVATMGFRGEALASIGEISRMTLRSRTAESPGGSQIEVHGGQPGEVAPCGCPVGTTIEVYNLFYNTPVRRKFLRTTQTELSHITEALTRIALPLPDVHFTLRHNERVVFDLPAGQSARDRIAKLFGDEVAEALVWVDSGQDAIRVSGYAALPHQSRANNRLQYFFLNRRYIRDRALQHALTEAYRGLLLVGRFPIAFLSIEMPTDLVDVNVHPTKLEVRFQDSGQVYSRLLASLRTKFLSTDMTPRVATPSDADPAQAIDEQRAEEVRHNVVDWAKGQMGGWSGGTTGGEASIWDRSDRTADRPLELARLDRPRMAEITAPASCDEDREPDDATPLPAATGSPALPWSPAPIERRPIAMQIHNRYLVAESDDGMMVIDQHALHERILFEQLRHRIESGALESQTLLVPEPVHLAPVQAAMAVENRELLAQLGLAIEPFGGDTVLVSSFPAMLAKLKPGEILQEMLEQIQAGGKAPDRRTLLGDLMHTIACKAAVKAGDRLTPAEIDALLAQRHLVNDSHHCPHGRPTALVFTRDELDKQFKRI